MIVGEIALSAALVTIGKWARGESLTAKYALSGGVLILLLLIIAEANEELADGFGALILCTCVLTYGPNLAQIVNNQSTAKSLAPSGKQYSGEVGGNNA